MDFGFRATDDLPRAHWDETEFNLGLTCQTKKLVQQITLSDAPI